MTQEERTQLEERIVDVLKTVYEIILLPLTTFVIRRLKEYEGEDVYDIDISYGIFEVFKRSKQ